jgi:hypothetical protein
VFAALNNILTTTGAMSLATMGRTQEQYVTELRRFPEGWLAVGGLALLGLLLWAVIWMYRHEGRAGASSRARGILAGIRCLILLLLAAILLEPVRVKILRKWIDSYTIVLADSSSSMDLSDHYRDPEAMSSVRSLLRTDDASRVRRADVGNAVLGADDARFLRQLAENNRVKLYAFSGEPEAVSTLASAREPELAPAQPPKEPQGGANDTLGNRERKLEVDIAARGPATNIERAFRRSVESLAGTPIAGVVVLSDGGFNQGAPAEEVARLARERQVPVHVVGIGDPSPPRNVQVVTLEAPENVFQKDPFTITASLSAEGVGTEAIHVSLYSVDATTGGERRQVASQTVRADVGQVPVTFELRPERVGRYTYTVTATELPGETVSEDNTKQATVSVIDTSTRVLIVAGGPSWDYRFVTKLLERDDSFDVSCWLQSADFSAVRDGDTVIDHLPTTAEELFEYDVILLFDPEPQELTNDWARLADRFVSEYGGGLLYQTARPHASTFMRETALKPLHDLLPVSSDPEADLILNQVGHYQTKASPIEIPEAGFNHPILRMGDDPVSSKLAWQGIGEVYWHYPVLREKPVATPLIRHGDPRMRNAYGGHVLAAVQFVGGGRVGFLGFDSSWRWRRYGEGVYDRFWVQFVRHLAEGKLIGGNKRATLLVENEHPSIGQAVAVSVRMLDKRFEPITRDEIRARYQVDSERGDFVLTGRPDRPGWFEGRFVPNRIGSYRISVSIPDADPDEPHSIEREVVVARPNLEILHPQMNKAALLALAEQSGGGRYWRVDQGEELARSIPDLHEEIPVRSRPLTLWDNWKTLALLVALMSIEWAARTWNRLL